MNNLSNIFGSRIRRQIFIQIILIFQQGQGEHRFPSGHYDIAMWDQGLRHGPAVYYHTNGGKEECTYVEGYENGPSTVYFAKLVLINENILDVKYYPEKDRCV